MIDASNSRQQIGVAMMGSRAPATPVGPPANKPLRIAAWSAIGAGSAGLLGLVSTLPFPELFSLDAQPGNAVVLEPRLLVVLIGHYAILAAGGTLGLLAGVLFSLQLRRHRPAAAAALLLAAGSVTMGYAAAHRTIDVALHDGRSTIELSTVVWTGGAVLLSGTAILTLALRRDTSKGFLLLGLASPALVAAGTAVFAVVGPDIYPTIWGVTFPPPPDYLLAAWFIVLGWQARTGRLQPVVETDPSRQTRQRRQDRSSERSVKPKAR